MPVFARYSFDEKGNPVDDTAAAAGEQGGLYLNGARPVGGAARFDGCDDFVRISADPAFQLDRGTIDLAFRPTDQDCDRTVTVLSRDSAGLTEGSFRIDLAPDGVVRVVHETAGGLVDWCTPRCFVRPCDRIEVSYSWDVVAGGRLVITNATTGESFGAATPPGLTMDQGDDCGEPWLIGAGMVQPRPGKPDEPGRFFEGSVDLFQVSDSVDNRTGPDGVVTGTAGGDLIDLTYTGDPDGDRIDAGDAIIPGDGPDDDRVVALDGDDTVLSGAGRDTVDGGRGNDVVDLGAGDDSAMGGDGDDLLDGRAGDDTLRGGDGRDSLTGGDGDDLIAAGRGDDFVAAGEGDDTAFAEDGADYVDGLGGDDLLTGGAGDDTMLAGGGDDTVSGDRGNDLITANPGNDLVFGGDGADTVEGNDGCDTVFGGAGDDVLASGPGADSLFGGNDRDSFRVVESGGHRIDGGEGGADFDRLTVFGRAEIVLDAGRPEDGRVFYLDADGNRTGVSDRFVNIERVEIVDPSLLDGVVEGGAGADLIDAGYTGDPEGDRIDAFDSLENFADAPLLGTPEPGTFTEQPGGRPRGDNRDAVTGGAGNDTIRSGAGDDIVYGGEDDDLIFGEIGADDLVGDAGRDTIFGGEGVNRLFGGVGADSLVGGEQTDVIFGGADDDTVEAGGGEDSVEGGAGADLLIGGQGADTLSGDDGDDRIFGGLGDDVIRTGLGGNFVDAGGGANTVLAGDGDDTLRGGAGADAMDGAGGNDLLDGQGGDDSLSGGDGDDTIFGGAGRDTLEGGAGNDRLGGGTPGLTGEAAIGQTADTISGGDGDDLIDGSSGDDLLNGDDGNDTIGGGSGLNTIFGGAGDDVLFASAEIDLATGAVTEEADSGSLARAVAAEGGGARVDGGRGGDRIIGTSNNDTLVGGDGNDTIEGRGGSDRITGNAGNDKLLGEDGDDTVDGGSGNDDMSGGSGQDSLTGGSGNDQMDGDDGDDRMFGGDGNDVLRGGQGQDRMFGGAGNDVMFGGEGGVDSMEGGADRDTAVIRSLNDANADTFNGDTTGDDFDTLDLSAIARAGFRIELANVTIDPDGDSRSGTAIFRNASGGEAGRMRFFEVENIVPCFTSGSMIATPRGEVPVETLRAGDKVITRDNGIQEIVWTGRRSLSWAELQRAHHLRPVLIRRGTLGHDVPERDLLVSPNHRLLVANDRTALYFDEHEVLVAAKHLVGARGVLNVDSAGVTYIHFMCAEHQVVLSDGAWTESFQPGDQTLRGMGNAQRTEIFELFPGLRSQAGRDAYVAARRTLRRHEALVLLKG